MTFRFSPSKLALGYIALSVLVLALFAIPLWYAWRVNIATFKTYVDADDVQTMVHVFDRGGAKGLAAAIESRVGSLPGDEIMLLADPSKLRLAGNLPAWPAAVPDAPGTYGLELDLGGSTMRVVASHMMLPGGYHLLMGRESARFQSLVNYFWYGIAGATGIALLLGAGIGWLSRRALLSEIHEISRAASAIVEGNLTRRLSTGGGSNELDTLARTVNGMLEQLARQNVQLEGEIAVRRQAEQALHRAHDDLEGLVAQRTEQLAQTNESLRRSETYLAEAQRLSHAGSFGWSVVTRQILWSEETFRIFELAPETKPTVDLILQRTHPEDRALVQQTIERAVEDGKNFDLEHRLMMPNGAVKYVHVVAHASTTESEGREFVGGVVDVTEQRQARSALEHALADIKRSERDLSAIINDLPTQAWRALPDGSTEFQSQRWLDYTGLTAEEARGWGWRNVIHPEDSDQYVAKWLAIQASKAPGEAEARFRRFDGEYRWFLMRVVPVLDEQGNITKWYGTNTDIEDRKRAEAFLAGEKRLLEMIAKGNALSVTLDALCRLVEEMSCGSLCSILLLDPDGKRLRHAAAPSLPKGYTEALDGSPIGLDVGPCGVAAYLTEPVVVPDIQLDARWPEYRALATAHGLRACSSTPIRSSNGRVFGTFALFSREPGGPTEQQQNIIEQFTHLASIAVERTRTEEELKRSEQGYALAMEAARDGHWDWIVESDEFYASPRMLEIYGFPPDTIFTGRADFLARFPFHPEDRPKWEQAAEAHFAGKTARFEMELRMIRRGETRWIHLSGLCSRDAAGAPVRWTGSVSDITERKCAEAALRESEERFALAVAGANDGIWDWDIVTDQMFFSERTQHIFGLAPGATVRHRADWRALIKMDPDDAESSQRSIDDYLAGALPTYNVEWRVKYADGTYHWIRVRGVCLRDASGKAYRMAGSTEDITDRKAADDELRTLERQLRQAQRLEAMGTLAGGVAHDFNNILGAILGYGEMALRDAPRNSRLRRDLESITAAGERGRALVDRILAFSRSGVGERVVVHVEKIVRESLDLLMANLPAGITVKAELHASRAAMLGDPTQVHQVFMNLATNGIQAMEPGGILRVSLSEVRLDSHRVTTTGTVAAGNYILLKVADSGRGIPAEILYRIFDPFFTTKEVGVGTGLGLSLVHGIVTEVGGAIDVASTVGGGSVFVYLPRVGDAADGVTDEQPAMPRGDQQRVLVVDDEEPLVRLATETLEELGYAPVGFTSSAAALEAFRADPKRFDAVITDERMPGLSGSALIREVRSIRRSIPILLVTGYVGGMVMGRAYNAGADEVLKKPLSAHDLANSLARVLNA